MAGSARLDDVTAGYRPAPYPADEAARQSVVGKLLSAQFDMSELDAVVGEVADLFDVPIAAATVLDNDWQRMASQVGLAVDKTTRAVAFCGYTINHIEPFCVPDALLDERFAGNPLVIHDPGIRFYIGARLMVSGMPVGSLCAIGQEPQGHVDTGKVARLEALARSASDILDRQFGRIPDRT